MEENYIIGKHIVFEEHQFSRCSFMDSVKILMTYDKVHTWTTTPPIKNGRIDYDNVAFVGLEEAVVSLKTGLDALYDLVKLLNKCNITAYILSTQKVIRVYINVSHSLSKNLLMLFSIKGYNTSKEYEHDK